MERLTIQRIDVDDSRWLEFITLHPRGLIFHHPAWIQLISDAYGYQKFILAVIAEDGQLQGGMPMVAINSHLTGDRLVSLPFTDYCPPLANNDEVISVLADYLISSYNSGSIPKCEVRWSFPDRAGVNQLNSFTLHNLSLSKDYRQNYQIIKKGHRYNIRKAEKSGLVTRRIYTQEELLDFYRLHLNTRRRLGVPVQPQRFFDLLWIHIIERGLGFASLVYHQEKPVAGAVFLIFQKTITYKYSASDADYWSLYPNNLLLWDAVKWACQNDLRIFDFGNSPIENLGLRSFKQGWGTLEQPLTYTYLGSRKPGRHNRTLDKTMTAIIKHSPPLVCQLAGDLLYRHFG